MVAREAIETQMLAGLRRGQWYYLRQRQYVILIIKNPLWIFLLNIFISTVGMVTYFFIMYLQPSTAMFPSVCIRWHTKILTFQCWNAVIIFVDKVVATVEARIWSTCCGWKINAYIQARRLAGCSKREYLWNAFWAASTRGSENCSMCSCRQAYYCQNCKRIQPLYYDTTHNIYKCLGSLVWVSDQTVV